MSKDRLNVLQIIAISIIVWAIAIGTIVVLATWTN